MTRTYTRYQTFAALSLVLSAGCASNVDVTEEDYTNVRPGAVTESSFLWEKAADGEDSVFWLDDKKVKFGETIAVAPGSYSVRFNTGKAKGSQRVDIGPRENVVWKPMGILELETDEPLTDFPLLSVGSISGVYANKMKVRHPAGEVVLQSGEISRTVEVRSNETTRLSIPTSTILFDVQPGRLKTICPNRQVHIKYGFNTFPLPTPKMEDRRKFVIPHHESLKLRVRFDEYFEPEFPVRDSGVTTIKLPRLEVEDYEVTSGGTTTKVRGTFSVTPSDGAPVPVEGCEAGKFETNSGVNLPEGRYRVRVNAPGQQERVYDVTL